MSVVTQTIQSFTLSVDGAKHTLTLPLSIADTIKLRSEVGWSQAQLFEFLKSPDLDTFAICVWLARLQSGETVTFQTVAAGITYASKLEIGAAEDDHPEG